MADEPTTPDTGSEPPAPHQPEPPAPATPPTPQHQEPSPPVTGEPAAPEPAAAKADPGQDWKAEAEKWKQFSRKHEDQTKATRAELAEIKAAQERQLSAFKKALGLEDDDTPPDPKVLAEQLAAQKAETDRRAAEHRESEVMLAVYRAAGKYDADAEALLDSRAFQLAVKDLDPSTADFADRIGEAITKAVENNPRYKVTPAAPAAKPKPEPTVSKSGAPMNGAPGGNRQWTDADVAAATPQEVTKAIADGLLIDLGVNPPKPKR